MVFCYSPYIFAAVMVIATGIALYDYIQTRTPEKSHSRRKSCRRPPSNHRPRSRSPPNSWRSTSFDSSSSIKPANMQSKIYTTVTDKITEVNEESNNNLEKGNMGNSIDNKTEVVEKTQTTFYSEKETAAKWSACEEDNTTEKKLSESSSKKKFCEEDELKFNVVEREIIAPNNPDNIAAINSCNGEKFNVATSCVSVETLAPLSFEQKNLPCFICKENPVTTVAMPCGHDYTCADCAPIFFNFYDKCQVCRNVINLYRSM